MKKMLIFFIWVVLIASAVAFVGLTTNHEPVYKFDESTKILGTTKIGNGTRVWVMNTVTHECAHIMLTSSHEPVSESLASCLPEETTISIK